MGIFTLFLKKITSIKNVGKFKSGGVSGGEYAKYTLFYGGNGRGKTTLCAVLRSLRDNKPVEITRRQTFGSQLAPEVQMLLDSGPIKFNAGAWNNTHSDIHIFDQHFIRENVHAGVEIALDQRRNFYRVVVGADGVRLANELDELDAKATSVQTTIKTDEKALLQHVPAGMTLEKFLNLSENSKIDEEIAQANLTLKAIDSADKIAKRSGLIVPDLPDFPSGFETILAKSLDDVSNEAAKLVEGQVQRHEFHEDGEAWLAKGTAHIRDEKCPFCSLSVAGNQLVAAYRGYFSEAYAAHKAALTEFSYTLDKCIGETAALQLHSCFKEAATEAEFWGDYCDHGYTSPATIDEIIASSAALHTAARKLIDQKINAPLENIIADQDFQSALTTWNGTRQQLQNSCDQMEKANLLIQGVKSQNALANKASAESTLAMLQAVQKRYSATFVELALGYTETQAEKDSIVAAKAEKKIELDAYDSKIFSSYESDVNKILTRFNAGFRLSKSGKNYQGKIPQSAYCLRFGSNDLDIGKSKPHEPTFETTMSAGDKSTFALAFFLTQVERDPSLSEKIVVFDDPFTSLDEFRREMTAKAIVRIGETASQVIVLSHDKYFLDAIRQKIHGASCVAMQIMSTSDNSMIGSWDIEWEVKEGYLKDHMTLLDFAIGKGGEAKDMLKTMRPLLEKYIRYRFPNDIQEGHWLGDMIGVIRAEVTHPLNVHLNELDDINDYTKDFHHDPNTAFNHDEVLAYAKRTLNIVGGC
jgi:wobble nucleotide-excising tRNase